MTLSYEILVHFRRNWLHYDEKVFVGAERPALSPYYHALLHIAEIDCNSAKFRTMFPKSTVKRYVHSHINGHSPFTPKQSGYRPRHSAKFHLA